MGEAYPEKGAVSFLNLITNEVSQSKGILLNFHGKQQAREVMEFNGTRVDCEHFENMGVIQALVSGHALKRSSCIQYYYPILHFGIYETLRISNNYLTQVISEMPTEVSQI